MGAHHLFKKVFGGRFGGLKAGMLSGATVTLALLIPMATMAQDAAKLGGTLGVANVTAGDTDYKSEVAAKTDELVKIQMYYVNQEPADATRPAVSVRARIELPTGGERAKVIKSSLKGENTDALERQVTVNIDSDGRLLQYVPGSAVWKRNTATAETPKVEETRVSDDLVTGAQGTVIGNVQPGEQFGGTISVLARVVAPGVKATMQSQKKGQTSQWSSNNLAAPGDTMRYLIGYQNSSSAEQKSVLTRAGLAQGATLVPGTTTITNSANPNGAPAGTDAVSAGGLILAGTYAPGANAFVGFEAAMPAADKLKCGDNEFRSTAVVRPEGLQEYYASALTIVRRDCGGTPAPAPAPTPNSANPPAPTPAPAPAPAAVYSCDKLTITKLQGREAEIKVAYTARNGATLKSVTYNFGDDSQNLTTDKPTVRHSYANDGTFTVSASLVMTVNGKDQSVVSNACSQAVAFGAATPPATPTAPTATPTALPDTGIGETMGLVVAVSIIGALGHRLYLTRKLSV